MPLLSRMSGGLSMREMKQILRSFRGVDIIGGDVVCFVPHLDPSQVTALHISSIMHDIVTVMAGGVARKNWTGAPASIEALK